MSVPPTNHWSYTHTHICLCSSSKVCLCNCGFCRLASDGDDDDQSCSSSWPAEAANRSPTISTVVGIVQQFNNFFDYQQRQPLNKNWPKAVESCWRAATKNPRRKRVLSIWDKSSLSLSATRQIVTRTSKTHTTTTICSDSICCLVYTNSLSHSHHRRTLAPDDITLCLFNPSTTIDHWH